MDESEKVPEGTDPSAPHSDANEEQTLDIDKQNKLNLLDNQIESLENIENFLQAQTHNNDNEDAAFDRLQNDTTDGTSQIKKLNDVGRRDSFDNDKSDAYSETDDTSINKQNSDSVRRRSGSTEVESSISEAIAHNQHDGGENERDESEHGENELDKSELGENDRENSEDGENELAEDEDKVESSNDSTVKSKRKEQPMDTSDIPENDADLQKNDNEMETEEADDAEADHDHEENEKENASVTEADNDEDRPEFEDAPDHNADDSEHEEQSQETEDPFDELLKDKSSKDTSKAAEDESKEESAKNSAAEDDDNLDTTEERSQDDSLHEDGELEEVIGEESEECLLPDKDEQLIGEVSSHQPETKDASTENCEAGDSEAEKANEEEKETEDAEEEEKETGDVEEDEKETGDVEEEVKETGDVEEEEKETGDVEEEEKETGVVEKEEKETGDAEEEDEKETGDAEEEEKETEDAEEEGNTAAEASEVVAIRKRKFPEKKGAAASKDADESLADEEETVGGETTVDETNTENDKEADGSVAGADESVADDDEEEEAPAEEEEGGGGRPAGGGRQGLVREVLESVPRLCARCGAKRPAPFLYYDEGKRWLCSAACLAALRAERPGAFRLERRKMIVCETEPVDAACARCLERKACAFAEKTKVRFVYYCSPECLRDEREGDGGREATMLARAELRDIPLREQTCRVCRERKTCRYETVADVPEYVCDDGCKPTAAGSEPRRPRGRPRKLKAAEESPPRRRSPKARAPLPAKAAPAKATPAKAAPAKATPAKATPAKLPPGRPPSAKGTPAKAQPTPAKAHSSKKRAAAAQEASPRASGPPLLKLKVMGNATDKYLERGAKVSAKSAAQAASAREERERSFVRACAKCGRPVDGDERNLSWETMDFCDESCLGDYQTATGSRCANCRTAVTPASLGKYCVRFGYDVRQFCRSRCLEEFKKGLKICCYCQRDITGDCEGFLAPVGDKGQFKDFCSQPCMEKFDRMSKNPAPAAVWAHCAVCSHRKLAPLEVQVDGGSQRLCSEPCFAAFKFVNNVFPDQCRWCKKYFERKAADAYTIYADNAAHCFCTKACFNVYISNSRHIVPCNWCKVKKYNFDMIKKTLASGQSLTMCSLNCLTLYRVSINAVSSRRVKCDKCERVSQAQYHLTMSDATVRNFCTYQCVMSFQGQYGKPGAAPPAAAGQPPPAVPTGAPRRTALQRPLAAKSQIQNATTPQRGAPAPVRGAATPARGAALPSRGSTPRGLPVIAAAESPAGGAGHATRAKSKAAAAERPASPEPPPPPPPPRAPTPPPPPPKIYSHVLVKPPPPAAARNAATMARPLVQNRAVSCRPQTASKECQTGPELERRVLVPVPVPVYVPVPLAMFSLPFPVPVPLPLPVPVPVFVPTTRNSADGIMKEIKKIHDKMPTDPFEAELLMMAEMVAGEKKKADSDSETDDDNEEGFSPAEGAPGLEAVQNAAFGEDMLQMALKMATEYEEPPVDLESAMQASTITPAQSQDESHGHHHQQAVQAAGEQQRAAAALAVRAAAAGAVAAAPGGRKRGAPAARAPGGKRRRDAPAGAAAPAPPEPPAPPQEKPDANMCLKYTFGVNAWKQWVMTKNAEMEKSSIRRKPFKSEILQLTADELNYSLCLFVKEVRKPNGSEYAPDTIYYLVLGIQQYLFENGRIDNIFTDPYYEKFTECLDEVARKFSVLYNDSQYIVTRVEEEHLWESKQLGAHSPHVLLSTLMFFNTKHFNLVTVEEHMQLSFSHIMKHWKRNPNSPGAAKMPGSRNVLLRFYPPQAALEANSRKKKVYEQQENEENPLRCPVKLYEFYLSKCPESVKTRNDVFYLLPERSCVPDSPVWYSTQALAKDALAKMLHRVKMVKEINIALLTS